MISIKTPLTSNQLVGLKENDIVSLSGVIFTARDQAHKKMLEHLEKTNEMLLKGEIVYYAGPCPKKPNEVIGSVGPTTSYRMDYFTPIFAPKGLIYSIGKGERDAKATSAIKNNNGVHFNAIGGAGAYYKDCVKKAELIAFPELGAEAIYRLEVENFPLIVSII